MFNYIYDMEYECGGLCFDVLFSEIRSHRLMNLNSLDIFTMTVINEMEIMIDADVTKMSSVYWR